MQERIGAPSTEDSYPTGMIGDMIGIVNAMFVANGLRATNTTAIASLDTSTAAIQADIASMLTSITDMVSTTAAISSQVNVITQRIIQLENRP